jgi:hypothetical protein
VANFGVVEFVRKCADLGSLQFMLRQEVRFADDDVVGEKAFVVDDD